MFKQAGQFEGKILKTTLAESRFNKNDSNAFDVCLQVQGPDNGGFPQVDWWRGEISQAYGKGNMSNKTQKEITLGNLHKIGFEGEDLSTLEEQLVGKIIEFTVEAREYEGKTYYDVKYIGGNDFAPKALSPEDIQARLAAMSGGQASAPVTAGNGQSDQPDWG